MHENIFSLVLLIWLKIDLIDSESRIRARGVEENEVKCFKFVRVCVCSCNYKPKFSERKLESYLK